MHLYYHPASVTFLKNAGPADILPVCRLAFPFVDVVKSGMVPGDIAGPGKNYPEISYLKADRLEFILHEKILDLVGAFGKTADGAIVTRRKPEQVGIMGETSVKEFFVLIGRPSNAVMNDFADSVKFNR